MKKLLLNSKLKTTFLLFACLLFVSVVSAQSPYTSVGSGNWNADATWSGTGVPGVGDVVNIANGHTITVTATAAAASVTFTGAAATLTVNSTITLTVSGAVTLNNSATADRAASIAGSGTLSCAHLVVGGTTTTLTADATTILTSTIANFNISGDLNIDGEDTSNDDNNASFLLPSGTVTVGGTIETNEESGSSVTISMNTGAQSGTLILSGATPFTDTLGTPTITVNGTTATVNYAGSGQTIRTLTYTNLSTSGSGIKSLAANATIGGNLNIGTGSTLDLSTFTANRSSAGGTLTVAGTMQLGGTTGGQTGSNFPTNYGTVTLTGGTVMYDNATGSQTIYSTPTYATLTLGNTSGTQIAGGNLTVGTLNTTAGGTFNMSTFTLSVTTVSHAGTIRTQNTSATPYTTGKTWGGTVQFDGAGQTVPAGTYNDLIFAGSGTKTLAGILTVGSNLTINTSIVANLATFTSTAVTLTLGGAIQTGGLSYGGTTSGASVINSTFFATATGRINVTCSGAGIWTGATSTNWATASNWCGNLLPTSTSNVVINSGGNQPTISSAAVCNNITLGSGATLTINSTLAVGGNWTNNGASTPGTGTVTLSGTCTIGGSAATTFPNLTTTGTIVQGINTNVSGDFNKTAGTYNISSSANSYTLAVTGDFSNSAGNFNVSNGANSSTLTVGGTFGLSGGTFTLENTTSATGGTVTVTGLTTISGTGVIIMDNAGSANTCSFNAVDFTTSGTGGSSNDSNRSNCSLDFGLGTVVNHSQFKISGNFVHTSTNVFYTSASVQVGSIIFNGGGAQTLSYSGTNSQYTSMTVNSGSTLQLLTNLTFGSSSGLPASTFLVNGTLDTQTFILGGANTSSEIFTLASGGTLRTANTNGIVSTTVGTISTTMGTRNFNTAANYIFDGTANQNTSFPVATMNNLTIANTGAGGANTVTVTTAAPTVNGTLAVTNGILNAAAFQIVGNATNNFTLASGTTFRMSGATTANFPTLFTSGHCLFNAASTVEYFGATQTVSATPTYGNLTISTAGTKTAGGALTVAGNLTINTTATTIFAGSTFTHNIAGNWINNGAFTANTSTINFDGTTAISGSSTTSFNNVTISGALTGPSAANMNVAGTWNNAGTYTHNGGTVTFNGTAQSITGSATTFNNVVLATSTSTKTFGVGTTIAGNLNINTGVKADLGTFKHTSATLTTGGSVRTTGNAYGGTGSPAIIDTTYFAANTGYLNVGSCGTYSIASIAPAAAVCITNAATINVTSTVGNLPDGTYTVYYTLGAPNAGSGSASMTVTGGTGSGFFTTSALASSGTTGITINYLRFGCVSAITSGNTTSITVTPNNIAGAPSSTPTLCINTALTAITHTTTGATGIGSPTGLPSGVTAGWAANTITISGTPSASGTFNYSIPLTGGCGSINATGTITVTPDNIVGAASSTPTLCINTALTAITHSTTGATGIGSPTGLPSGVTAGWAANTITISGTPTASGTFNYSIPLTGGCGSVNATGTITVTPNNTVGSPSSTPTLCINTALTAITHTTTGATGIGSPTGLPSGVTAGWAANTITISGTPTVSGTFNYSIPLTGGCGSINATGTITVTPDNIAGAASSTPTLCINTALTAITHSTTGATGIDSPTGLPSGVTAGWAANTITISGTPTASGTFNYSIPLTGGCGSINATGTITVTPDNTVGAASSTPTLCINTALTAITHTTTVATGIGSPTGLPSGVTAGWAANTITISGTPTASGTFNYSIPLTGGCGSVLNATGTITVTPDNTAGAASSTPTLCINTALTAITHSTTGATGIGSPTGLPSGVTAGWAANTITISGTPTASGTFNYSIPLTGGCGSVNATGTITVTPDNITGAASSTPTLCINTALTAITHSTTGATGIGSPTGLPSGVTAGWAANTITISGTPTASGTFNYSIPLTGGCGSVNATGTITVTPDNIAGAASSTPTLCINTALTAITHSTTGATGIGSPTGLPSGVTAGWAANTITINGTPTVSGTFNYSIPLTGGCGSVNALGTITVEAASVGGTVASDQTICYGTEPSDLTLSGETGLVVKWQSSSDALFTSPTDIAETATTLSGFTIGALTTSTYFRAVVQNGTCSTDNSASVLITVDALTVGGTVSSDQTICSGSQPADLTLSGQTGSVVNWESSIDPGFSSPTFISNTSTTLLGTTIGSLTQDTYFRAIVQNGSCDVAESASVLITVNETPVGGTVTGGAAVCSGSTSGLLTLSGHTGTIVRWEYAVSPFTSWTTIVNTADTYTSGALTQTTQFRAVVESGVCGEVNSTSTTVTIATATWTSGAWDNISGPDATMSAVISDTYVSGGADINACSLTVNNSATVIISSGDTVTLAGPITVNTGCLVTFNNNANLIQSGTTNTNSGAIIIKRNSSALKRLDYTLWSSPVSDLMPAGGYQTLLGFSPQTSNIAPTNIRFYTYNTNTNQYDITPPAATTFANAKGYLIRMPNNHPAATPTIWVGQFAGIPNNGDYNYTLVDGGGGQQFNLVGNPYPSPIDAQAFVADVNNASSITGALYFWRKTNNTLSPTYCTWTTGGFVSNGEAQVFDPNDVIQTGQGFFVEASGFGTTVNFNNSMRIDNHADQTFKTSVPVSNATPIERNRIWLNATSSTGSFSQAMVGYITNATQGVDASIDGKYINDGDIALTSIIGSTRYAIQGRALPFEASDIVPMNFKAANAGDFTIAIDHVDGLFSGSQDIYLRDNLTGIIHDLHAAGYTFSSTAGTFDSRFEVLYQLPLGYITPVFNASQVVIYKNSINEFVINSSNFTMATVKVFDVRGRLLLERKNINATQTTFDGGSANEVLLIQITSEDGIMVTKKVIR